MQNTMVGSSVLPKQKQKRRNGELSASSQPRESNGWLMYNSFPNYWQSY